MNCLGAGVIKSEPDAQPSDSSCADNATSGPGCSTITQVSSASFSGGVNKRMLDALELDDGWEDCLAVAMFMRAWVAFIVSCMAWSLTAGGSVGITGPTL